MPKIFHGQPHESFIGHLVGRLIKPVIIADFDLLKEAFAKKELCSRFGLEEVRTLESKWRKVRYFVLIADWSTSKMTLSN